MSGKHIVFSPSLILSYLILVPGVQPAPSRTDFRAEVPGPGSGLQTQEAKRPTETYPYEIPEWYQALREKLNVPCSFGVPEPTSLKRVVEELEKLTGVSIGIDAGQGAPEKKVRPFREVNLPLRTMLRVMADRWIADRTQYELRLKPGQAVITDKPEKYPVHELVALRKRMERIRHFGDEATRAARDRKEKEKETENVEQKLRSRRVQNLRFSNTSFRDVLATVQHISGVNMFIVPELEVDEIWVDGTFEAMSLLEMLEKILDDAELGYLVQENTVFVMSGKKLEKKEREAAEVHKRRARRREELRNRKIDRDLQGKPLREITGPLREILGVPVYPGPRVWKSNPRVPGPTEGKSIGDLQTAFRKIGVDIIIETDAVFLLKKI